DEAAARRGEDERLHPEGARHGRAPSGPQGRGGAPDGLPSRAHRVPPPQPQGGPMRRTRAGTGHGSIYRPKSHKGTPTPFYWLKYRLPGMRKPKREPTNPRTSDEVEARRQLHARMGESATVRVQRETVEELTVNDLLDLYVLDCEDKGQPIQVGRVEPWR